MHEHDADLVAALAEGALSPADARAAEAEVATCARCTADLSAQRAAVDALRSLPALQLADAERTALRAAVAGAVNLDLEAEPAPQVRRRARRSIPWPSVAVAALSVLAVVAIVPLVGTLTTSGSDDDAQTIELALSTTIVEPASAAEAAPAAGTAEALPVEGGDELSQSADAAPPTLAAAATESDGGMVERVADGDLRAILDDPSDLLGAAVDPPGPCDPDADAFFGGLEGVLVAPLPELGAIGYLTTDGTVIERIVVLDPDTCEVLASFG